VAEPLLQTAKLRAAASGLTLSELVEDALRFHLARLSAEAKPFQLRTVSGKLVRPELDLDRTSALETLEDEAAFSGIGKN